MESWSIEDVLNKIEWEGGIFQALEWGLHSDMIDDPELSALWLELEKILPVLKDINRVLDDAT